MAQSDRPSEIKTESDLLLYTAFSENKPEDAHKILSQDPGESGKLYAQYLQALKEIAEEKNSDELNRKLTHFLKNMLYSALKKHEIHAWQSMELCITGSLARGQATAYSDIDCFLIFDDRVTDIIKETIKDISTKIFLLADGLFFQSQQFSMDPIGISLNKLHGSVTELTTQVLEQENQDNLGFLTCSILNAKSISGSNRLLSSLQTRIKDRFKDRGRPITPQSYFDKTVNEFKGPSPQIKTIIIKSDLIRPVDFILQGLRYKENIPLDEFDTPEKLLNELLKRNKITPFAKKIILYVQLESYRLRADLHRLHGKEYEEIERNPEIDQLINLVAWLRGSLHHYQTHHYDTFDMIEGTYLTGTVSGVDQHQKKFQSEMYSTLAPESNSFLKPTFPWKPLLIAIGIGLLIATTIFTLGATGVIGAGIAGAVTFNSVLAAGGAAFPAAGAAISLHAAAVAHAAAVYTSVKISLAVGAGILLTGLSYFIKKEILNPLRTRYFSAKEEKTLSAKPNIIPANPSEETSRPESSYSHAILPGLGCNSPENTHTVAPPVLTESKETQSVTPELEIKPEVAAQIVTPELEVEPEVTVQSVTPELQIKPGSRCKV